MKLLVKSKQLISYILVVALLTGCGATLRSSEKVQNEPLDTLIKLENKENQILSTTEENSSYTSFAPLLTYEPLTTEIPEGFCLALAKKSAQLMIEIENKYKIYKKNFQ